MEWTWKFPALVYANNKRDELGSISRNQVFVGYVPLYRFALHLFDSAQFCDYSSSVEGMTNCVQGRILATDRNYSTMHSRQKRLMLRNIRNWVITGPLTPYNSWFCFASITVTLCTNAERLLIWNDHKLCKIMHASPDFVSVPSLKPEEPPNTPGHDWCHP